MRRKTIGGEQFQCPAYDPLVCGKTMTGAPLITVRGKNRVSLRSIWEAVRYGSPVKAPEVTVQCYLLDRHC